MRITDFGSNDQNERSSVAATVLWEDCDRPPQRIYFETDQKFGAALGRTPHAFLTACALPAMHEGERRVSVDAEVCPELQSGLVTVMTAVHDWYSLDREVPKIEARPRPPLPVTIARQRAGCFLTGGIDSLAVLRANRRDYPLWHPGSIKDAVIVFGFEVEDPQAFRHVLDHLSPIANDAGVTLLPIYTNVRELNGDWEFWYTQFMGAALSAVAHALEPRLSIVSIASDYDIPNLRPHGSHPLMEPNLSSYDLKIHYEGITLSRLGKTKLLANWDVALQHLHVCNKTQFYTAERLNCGHCEKCIRTMLALLVHGALEKTRAFPEVDVSEELLVRTAISDKASPFYRELLDPLEEIGRSDLARCIKQKLAPAGAGAALRRRFAEFDRAWLNGTLRRLKRSVSR